MERSRTILWSIAVLHQVSSERPSILSCRYRTTPGGEGGSRTAALRTDDERVPHHVPKQASTAAVRGVRTENDTLALGGIKRKDLARSHRVRDLEECDYRPRFF